MPLKPMAQKTTQLNATEAFFDRLFTPVLSPSFAPLDSSYKANDLTLFPEMQPEVHTAKVGKAYNAPVSPSERVLSPSQADSDSPAASASVSVTSSSSSSSSARSDPKYREMKMKYLRALNVTTLAPGFRPVPTRSTTTATAAPVPLPAAIATPESTQPLLSRAAPTRLSDDASSAGPASPDLPQRSLAEPPVASSRDSSLSPLPSSPRTPSLLSQQLKALRGSSPVASESSSDSEPGSPLSDSNRGQLDEESDLRSSPIPIPRASRTRHTSRARAAGPLGDRRRRNGRVALDSVTDAPLPAFSLSSSAVAQPFTASSSVAFSFSEVFTSRSSHSMAPRSFALAGLAIPAPIYEPDEASESTGVAFSVEL